MHLLKNKHVKPYTYKWDLHSASDALNANHAEDQQKLMTYQQPAVSVAPTHSASLTRERQCSGSAVHESEVFDLHLDSDMADFLWGIDGEKKSTKGFYFVNSVNECPLWTECRKDFTGMTDGLTTKLVFKSVRQPWRGEIIFISNTLHIITHY